MPPTPTSRRASSAPRPGDARDERVLLGKGTQQARSLIGDLGVLRALDDRRERAVDIAEDGGALGGLRQRAQDLGQGVGRGRGHAHQYGDPPVCPTPVFAVFPW